MTFHAFVFGFNTPNWLLPWSVNHTFPELSTITWVGAAKLSDWGGENSVMLQVSHPRWPIFFAAASANHIVLSGATVIPEDRALLVRTRYVCVVLFGLSITMLI